MGYDVSISQTDRGTWMASTAVSPYFCFEAATEQAAIEKAERGLGFYAGKAATASNVREAADRRIVLSNLRRIRSIVPDMEAA